MHDRVKSALQKRRINRDHRANALGRQTCGKEHGVFFGDADIEKLFRAFAGQNVQARATRHRAGDADDVGVLFCELCQRASKNFLITRRRSRGRFFAFACRRIERTRPMKFLGRIDRRFQSAPFFCEHVHDHGDVALLSELKIFDQFVEIVSVDWTDIAKTKFFKQAGLDEEVFRLALPLGVKAMHVMAVGQTGEEPFEIVMDLVVSRIGAEAIEIFGDRADVFGDGPFVVVENNDQTLGRADHVVEGLERNPTGESRVAAQRDHMLVSAAQIAGCRHAECRAERSAGVPRAIAVVLTFTAIKKTARSAGLT